MEHKPGQEAAKVLTPEKRGCPLLSGKLDGIVQTYIQSALKHGAALTRSIATAKDQW